MRQLTIDGREEKLTSPAPVVAPSAPEPLFFAAPTMAGQIVLAGGER